jgi:hypothetical protein
MLPSIKLAGDAVLKIRMYSPTAKAVAVEATLVVNDFDPVPIATDDVDVMAV